MMKSWLACTNWSYIHQEGFEDGVAWCFSLYVTIVLPFELGQSTICSFNLPTSDSIPIDANLTIVIETVITCSPVYLVLIHLWGCREKWGDKS